jgi:hypothetical protein
MIESKADSSKLGNETGVDVSVRIHVDNKKSATRELFYILKALDEKFPEILMDAIELHIEDIIKDFEQALN